VHLDAVNERLAREGHRQIDLDDAALVERYGLADLRAGGSAGTSGQTVEAG
jgi:hypothetical protein